MKQVQYLKALKPEETQKLENNEKLFRKKDKK